MKQRKIQINQFPSKKTSHAVPLVFIHGAYVDSSCWNVRFIPFFQQHGFDCYSIDLSGHGQSSGHEQLDSFGINDYVDDLSFALNTLQRPAVVIGHSMGARVLERFLEQDNAAANVVAAIFAAPVPNTGTTSSAIKLSLRYPEFLETIEQVSSGKLSPKAADLMTKIYFSPSVTTEEAMQFLPMIGPESQLAVTEMALPDMRWRVRRPKLPALVIGGTEDAVFPVSMLHFLATTWQADLFRVPGAGHMLMLDHEWPAAAEHMLAWLKTTFLSN